MTASIARVMGCGPSPAVGILPAGGSLLPLCRAALQGHPEGGLSGSPERAAALPPHSTVAVANWAAGFPTPRTRDFGRSHARQPSPDDGFLPPGVNDYSPWALLTTGMIVIDFA